MSAITLNGSAREARIGQRLIDAINQAGIQLPQVCYHPQLGPIETCDTCMVEVDGKLVRACATVVSDAMKVVTNSAAADAAQRQAFDRVLENHLLYCTVCDNNNGNCTIHNTTKMLAVEHQQIPFKPKPFEVDNTNPFYRYDPDQCLLCGRCVEACQDVEVNETLSINWDDEHPRVLWDGGSTINESSCVSCGHCVTVCPCNALMEKSMIGHAGFLTALPKKALTARGFIPFPPTYPLESVRVVTYIVMIPVTEDSHGDGQTQESLAITPVCHSQRPAAVGGPSFL